MYVQVVKEKLFCQFRKAKQKQSNYPICFLGLIDLLWLDVIVVQLHKYLAPLCIRRRFDQFLSKRKLGPILYVRSRPGLSTIPAGPTELEAHCWHMLFPLTFIIRFKYCKKGTKLKKYPPFFVIMYLVTSKQRMSEL